LIAAAIFLAPYFSKPIVALAWGVFFGGLAQLLFQIPFLFKLGLHIHPKIFWQDEGLRRVMKLMLPAVFGVSVGQLSVLIDYFFASFLRQGSISWLYFSDRITSVPLGVFGVAIVTVILPHLSRKYADKSVEDFSKTIDWAIRFILVIGLPATFAIALLSDPILTTLFQHGKFDVFAVEMARKSLLGFTLGIPAFMLVKVFAAAFYSRQNIATPVKIAVIATLSNIVLDAVLIFPLAHAGLALATSLTSFLNAGLLFYLLRRRNFYQPGKGWWLFWLRLFIANALMALFLIVFASSFTTWVNWNSLNRALHLGLLCAGAFFMYCGSLWLSGMRFRDFILEK
jgi:putative peptidoglycan lipid II flippase